MWFINAVLHLISCPQSVFLPFQMRNEGLFWDWTNPKSLLHYSICDPATQAWGWQSNLAPSKRYQCCREGTVSGKKKSSQTFSTPKAIVQEMVHGVTYRLTKKCFTLWRICQPLPTSMTFITDYTSTYPAAVSISWVGTTLKKSCLLGCVRSAEWA